MHVEKSVSKFVREILEQDPSLVHELQQRKTAQREIAKKIKVQLIEGGNFISKDPVKLEGNVAVAITRYLKKLRIQQEELLGVKLVQDILKKGTTEVTDGLKHYKIRFHEDTDIHDILKVLVIQLERNDICSLYLSPNGSEFYVKKMAEQSFLEETAAIKAIDTLKLQDSLSLLKLMFHFCDEFLAFFDSCGKTVGNIVYYREFFVYFFCYSLEIVICSKDFVLFVVFCVFD